MFGEGAELTVPQAYAVQAAVTQLRCDRGERVIGYKVGCTSPTIRKQLGIDHSISGRLFDCEHHASGVTLSRAKFANLAIEGELAIELAREPDDADFLTNSIPTCVSRVFPVIELHNHIIRGEKPTPGELIANNAIHAGFCAGQGVSRADIGLPTLTGTASLSIFAHDQLLAECSGSILIQTIADSVRWLAEQLRHQSERLEPGQIILAGSVLPLFPIQDDCVVRVDAGEFGAAAAALAS